MGLLYRCKYLWHVADIPARYLVASGPRSLAQNLDGATLQVEPTQNAAEEGSLTTTTRAKQTIATVHITCFMIFLP